MIKNGEKIPFDIATERAIFYNLEDIESVDNVRAELAQQAQFIKENKFMIDNNTPFSLIEGMLSAPKPTENEVDHWAIALDDIGFIKSTVREILDIHTEAETKQVTNQPRPAITSWKKIRIEFPSENNVNGHDFVEISSEQSIANVLNDIYFLLLENKTSSFKPLPYTYLWDWILVRKRDNLPLIVKGIQNHIGALDVFSDGDTWQIQVLDEPLLNKAERFNLTRGNSNS